MVGGWYITILGSSDKLTSNTEIMGYKKETNPVNCEISKLSTLWGNSNLNFSPVEPDLMEPRPGDPAK